MNESESNSNDILGYVISYTLSKKITCNKLPQIINIEYVTTDDDKFIIGFNIKFSKSSLKDCMEDARIIADRISCLIAYETLQPVDVNFSGHAGIPKPGKTARVSKSLTLKWNIRGREPTISLTNPDVAGVLRLDEAEHHCLQLFRSAILHFNNGSKVEALKELFAIIEYDKDFPDHDKYYGLRQIFSHRPRNHKNNMSYEQGTIEKFKRHFGKEDFDYLKFEPENNVIIVDINSSKTQERLKKIVSDFINEIKLYIPKKLGMGESS
jgi:hypothetical protein